MLQKRHISRLCRKKHKSRANPVGRITAFTQAGSATTSTPVSSISFTYDANGNRQTSVQATTTVTGKGTTASPLVSSTQTTTKTYQIDPAGNKLLGFSQTMTQTGGATSTATVSYAYDANGALLTDGLRHYAYDSEGRLAAASLGWSSSSTKDDSITKYAHNSQAQRVFKTAPLYAVTNPPETATPSVLAAFTAFFESLWSPSTATTQKAGMSYVYDEDGTLIADTLTGGASTTWGQSAKYIYLPTASGPMPVAAIYGTKHYAIQSDHLNTPRRLTQSDGQVAWQWGYSAFGDEQPTMAKNRFANTSLNQSFGTTTVPAVTFNLRYPGQYFDQESNLHYNGHRSYDGKTGRYSQSDPIGLQGGWNKFGYSNQNPLSFTDPSGLLSSSEALAHYRSGTGTALDMDFSEIPTAFVKATDFPAVKAATNSACFDSTSKIDDKTGFTSLVKWLTVGNIILRLQGTLTTKCDCSWSFSGFIKSYDDIYDFNASTHRFIIGETLTSIGRNISGKEYDIRIRGAKSISQQGRGYGIPTCNICRKN